MKPIKLARMDCVRVCEEIGDFVISQVRSAGATGCVVGLSGGVDSSTTAALIQRAFDRHRTVRYELVGYILPSNLNKEDDIRDARSVAASLSIRHETHDIEAPNVLSTKAATEGKLLAGTGNKDEDFGIGYYTLFGDGAVHLSPIGGLSKRLVREMAAYLGLDRRIIDRVPTAGLEPGQSDYKDLGYDYDVVELVAEGLNQGFTPEEIGRHPQVVPVVEKQLDHYRRLFGSPKFDGVAEVVADVRRRHEIAKAKMAIIHPPSPAITLDYE